MSANRPGGRIWPTSSPNAMNVRPESRGESGEVIPRVVSKMEVVMKKALFSALALALLYGCASTPTDEAQPGAATPGTAPAAPVTTRPVQPPVAVEAGGSLKDPASALSKRSIFYELDKADIKDEYRPLLQAHGKYLAERRGTKMLVQGNCDERGSRKYNIALGQRRAEGVKRIL